MGLDVNTHVVEEDHDHDRHRHHARMTRNILFKVDTRVLPVLSLLFLCSFLDRTNVGNAKIIGLVEDLDMTNLQYNQGLAVFYATYIARYHDLSTDCPLILTRKTIGLTPAGQ